MQSYLSKTRLLDMEEKLRPQCQSRRLAGSKLEYTSALAHGHPIHPVHQVHSVICKKGRTVVAPGAPLLEPYLVPKTLNYVSQKGAAGRSSPHNQM
jgi:hypothetical protein